MDILVFWSIIVKLKVMKPGNISNQRILTEMKKLSNQKLSYLRAGPLPDDLYTWHFTFQGPQGTEFHEGLYHGQILLPYEYPFKPPDIVFMNKNGRFETNTKICLTITQYHPEEWNSAWTIRTMLEAVISLFAENIQGVGSMASSADVRTFLAKNSHSYVCQKCGPIRDLLPPREPISIKPKEESNEKMASATKEEEAQIERKQSQAQKPLNPPILFNLHSDNANPRYQIRKSDFVPQERQHSQRTRNVVDKTDNGPLGEEQEEEGGREEIIYVKQTNNQAEPYVSFRRHTKSIRQNMRLLNSVFSTLRWV